MFWRLQCHVTHAVVAICCIDIAVVSCLASIHCNANCQPTSIRESRLGIEWFPFGTRSVRPHELRIQSNSQRQGCAVKAGAPQMNLQ